MDLGKEDKLKFLVDTGADVSLIKSDKLNGEGTYDPDKAIFLQGIGPNNIQSFGTTICSVRFGKLDLTHEFHLVSKTLNLKYDGILGNDFFETFKINICYGTKTLKCGKNTVRFNSVNENSILHVTPLKIEIPARCGKFVKLPVINNSPAQGISEKREIQSGIFLAESLTNVRNNSCITSVINTTEKPVTIELEKINLVEFKEKVSKENVMTVKEDPDNGFEWLETVNSIECKNEGCRENVKDLERLEKLSAALDLNHLNQEEKYSMLGICKQFNDIFYLDGDKLGTTDIGEHAIHLKEYVEPIKSKPYRLPQSQKEEINKQCSEMLQEKIIEPSISPWNAPILLVPKKTNANGERKWRLVVDYRKLNDKTIGNAYPLPNIDDILDQLGRSNYFSVLDLSKGYHQVQMKEEDREKTAFSTPYGHYQYLRMPFGLKGAPSTFQHIINTALTGLQGIICYVYLDDIVVYAKTLLEHENKIIQIFTKIKDANLKLNPCKCQFLRKEVVYLGHTITDKGVLPDQSKIECVQNFPRPNNVKELKSFLGLSGYYRRFIKGYSQIAKPLFELLKKEASYDWDSLQENAFKTLKQILIEKPLLQYPDYSRPFIVTCDASGDGLGAVLSQGDVGKDLPVSFISRTLNKAEKNYSATEKEMLAIVWAIKYFRPYLYGRRFTVVTDHKALIWLFRVRDPGSRLIKWRIKLEEFDFTIIYKKGTANTNADALSRIPNVHLLEKNDKTENESDSSESEFDSESENSDHDDIQYIDDREKINEVLKEFHDSPIGGHTGMNRTFSKLKQYFRWKGMKKDIENYIRRCEICQKNKATQPKTKMPLVITPTASEPFEKCAMDIVGPLTKTSLGNKYILTFQDDLTKFSIAEPLAIQDAETIARCFVEKIILKFGIPTKILTDRGTNFLSELFSNISRLLGISRIKTSAYHPQSNGALERTHKTLTEYLRHYIKHDQSDWDIWIYYAIYAFNTTPHTATGYTPFELLFGRKPPLPNFMNEKASLNYSTYDDYVNEVKQRLQIVHQLASDKINNKKLNEKDHYDQKCVKYTFKIGDKVLLYDESVRRGRSKKLESPWVGPYTIIELHNVNAKIKKGRSCQTVHLNRLKYFYD